MCLGIVIKSQGQRKNPHWLKLISCSFIQMENKNGNEVAENKIYVLDICYWLRFLYAPFGKDTWWRGLYYGKRKQFHQIHIPPLYAPISDPKLDSLCGFDYMVPERGEECGGVRSDTWIMVQFNGHQHSCFRNHWRNSVGVPCVSWTGKMQDQSEHPSLWLQFEPSLLFPSQFLKISS